VTWTLRALIDALALYVMAMVLLPESRAYAVRFGFSLIAAISLFIATAMLNALTYKILFTLIILTCFALWVWYRVFQQKERSWLLNNLGIGSHR
jgi:hypothetical protein